MVLLVGQVMIEYNEKNIKHHIKQFRNIIESIEIDIDKETSKLLAEFYYNEKKSSKKEKIDETGEKNLPDNSKQHKIEDSKVNKINEEIQKKQDELNKLKKDILPYIVPLSSILTYNNEENKIIKILDMIKNDDTLKEIFNNQCEIIYNKSDCLTAIYNIVNKLPKTFNPSNIISSIKYDINKLLVNKDIDELVEFINQCIHTKKCEVEKHGEVMTPPWLIDDILNKFEEIDKDIFKRNYTWFDPCAGMGNFHIMIYKRLIKYHSHDDIINKMFYANEINKKNVFLYKLIFGENANINCGDSLKLSNDLKYDIIIGNPPYNSGIKNAGCTIYEKFIEKFIKQYNKYFSFINPPGWRKPMDINCSRYKLYNLMTKENHLIYLEIHDTKDGMKTFNAGTRYDWFIIDKNINNNQTLIKGIDNKIYNIDCNKWLFIPNGNINLINKIFDFNKKNTLNVVNERYNHSNKKYVSSIQNNIFKYTLLHSTPKTGPIYRYTNDNTRNGFNISKIIFGEAGINKIILDKEGKYGLTDGCIGINITNYSNNEINNIIKALESNKFKQFLQYFSFSIFRVEWRIFNYIKKDFYKYF